MTKHYHDSLPRWVKIPLPDGTVRVVTETSYTALTKSLASFAACLEKAEFVDDPGEMKQAHVAGGSSWKRLLSDKSE